MTPDNFATRGELNDFVKMFGQRLDKLENLITNYSKTPWALIMSVVSVGIALLGLGFAGLGWLISDTKTDLLDQRRSDLIAIEKDISNERVLSEKETKHMRELFDLRYVKMEK